MIRVLMSWLPLPAQTHRSMRSGRNEVVVAEAGVVADGAVEVEVEVPRVWTSIKRSTKM